ncbi:MAG: GNAT family N-acetyltransferase [Cyclobacteriaceae bacterium]|nr:GNAT family N-acetyltransferase [Cyclobacteriaceae bacterium]
MLQNEITILNTTATDLTAIVGLYDQVIKLQSENGYRVWNTIDRAALKHDIEKGWHYKMMAEGNLLCAFSVQFSDPLIWRQRDLNDGLYLHRIVTNPAFKGQKLFKKILAWACQQAMQQKRKFIRMDTWAENEKLIAYYQSFGFKFIENYRTGNSARLPIQNRNLHVALLELALP